MNGPAPVPEQLWQPDPQRARRSAIAGFARWVREHRGVDVDELDYAGLHAWSVRDIEGFWSAVAEHLGLMFHDAPTATMGSHDMPGAEWFPGSSLNYAEHALSHGPGRTDTDVAVLYAREDGYERALSYGDLRAEVARARAGLVAAGIGAGDRVVAVSPNTIETLVMFLASASLGAIWSSCSPDFGPRAVQSRFAQIEPTVLLTIDGYRYGGRAFDLMDNVAELQALLPTLRLTVLVPSLDPSATLPGTVDWSEFTAATAPLAFEPVAFGHPLWVLYSSGTTGLPKGIVHSHGGIVIEHMKALRLQNDLGPGDRFMWFTTTGWMMWNFLVSGLLVGATIVLFDGSPRHPGPDALWALAARYRVTLFGVSAAYLQSCAKTGLRPRDTHDLSHMRTLGSTGGPLSVEAFRWIGDAVGEEVQISSRSGGTDLCAAFLTSAPTVPVWLGELSCAALGADVHAWDERGERLYDEVGELVVTQAMPSMPVGLWNDPDGVRLRQTYFSAYPGYWRHGDWVRATPRGSFVVYGRSDSTLNRGGVRMGTADFYEVIEAVDGVLDSLVVDTSELGAGDDGAILCFLVLADGVSLSDVESQARTALRLELSPRHVPDEFIAVREVPRTLNGKKCEVPVKRILAGVAPDEAVSRDSLHNPDALQTFVTLAARRGGVSGGSA